MANENKQPQSDLISELNKLGENLGNLLHAAWESEERKSVEREIAAGIEQMNKKLSEATEKVKTDAYIGTAKRKVKDAWETARGPEIVSEVRQGILETLRKINEDLSQRTQPAQEATAEAAAAGQTPGQKPE